MSKLDYEIYQTKKDDIGHESLETLAKEIEEFTFNHDPYEYNDIFDSREIGYESVLDYLRSGDTEGMKAWFAEVVSECEIPEELEKAKSLLERISKLENSRSTEKKASLDEKIADAQTKSSQLASGKENIRTPDSKER